MATSFTITQPFLGAPLQFQPALGSKELEALVDAYVIGNGSKQDKLSAVTVDFFNHATVDLNTGALTRTYNVLYAPIPVFESPVESQSSGFSPPIFTPSPGSSATFGDSGYGSFGMSTPSMTPPTRALGSARVTKKAAAKKDTKKPKVEEARLPGFSIMTKDGIDVTTTAGRGTKTKEQREHAHLMRIMKACDACKRKKIRCDPSHRRSHNDMSRTSTSTSKASSSSARPSPQYESPGSAPTLTRQSTQASSAAFTPSNAIDDFILFPEDASAWNPEMSQDDLGQFNFDINDMDLSFPIDQSLDVSFYQQPFTGGDFNIDQHLGHSFYQQPYNLGGQQNLSIPLMTNSYDTPSDQYDLDQLLAPDAPVHTRPHPASQSQDSGQQARLSMSPGATDNLISSTSDWSVLESTLVNDSPSGDWVFSSPASAPTPTPSESPNSSSQQHVNRNRRPDVPSFATSIAVNDGFHESTNDSGSGILVDPSDFLDVPLLSGQRRSQNVPQLGGSNSSSAAGLSSLAHDCQLVSDSLRAVKSSRSEYIALGKELQRLRSVAESLRSSGTCILESILLEVREYQTQLQTMSTRLGELNSGSLSNPLLHTLDPEFHPEFFRQCQVEARRLVRSLCATINAVQAQNSGTHSPTNNRTLTSGRNLQLFSPSPNQETHQSSLVSSVGMWVDSTMDWQTSNGPSVLDATPGAVLREDNRAQSLSILSDIDGACSPSQLQRDSGVMPSLTVRDVPRYSLAVKNSQAELERLHSQASLTSHQDVQSILVDGSTTNSSVESQANFPEEVGRNHLDFQTSVAPDHYNVLGILSRRDDQEFTSRATSAQSLEIRQETSLVQSSTESTSRSTILQTTIDSQASFSTPAENHNFSLPMLAVISVVGSLFLSSKFFASDIPSTILILAPLLALTFSLPRPNPSTGFPTLNFALILGAVFLAAPSIQGLRYLRNICNEWVGNDSIVSVAKLALCAAMVAQTPTLFSQSNLACGVITLLHLLTGAKNMSPANESTLNCTSDSDIDDRQGSSMALLAMMSELSPVMAMA